ncbi:DUF3240 family protein [Massilia sp. PWRC2]|uniref:DUF3240 family protein n=1 Tax=Massilia sp. PWRC2 TaxID=2804626 RepID=UPI003CF1A9D1
MTELPHYNALLTLAIPTALEDEVLDFLQSNSGWASGFSILNAQGMGQGAPLHSSMERVQGRSSRRLVMVAGVEADLRELLQALARAVRSADVAYWISPLAGCGRLA